MVKQKTKNKQFNDHLKTLSNNVNNKNKINNSIIIGINKKIKRNRIKNFDLMHTILKVVEEKYKRTSPNIKYSHRDILICIMHFIKTHVSWRNYNGTSEIPISGKYLNAIHLKYIEKGVYEAINKKLLEIYMEYNKSEKLKYQSIDSSFIENKKGIYKNGKIKFNSYAGRKKYIKISHITDSYGVVIASEIFSSTTHDSKTVEKTMNNKRYNTNTKKYSKNNKNKQYFIADPGYDSKRVLKYVSDQGYIPVIKINKRRTKKENLQKLTLHKKKILKKRYVVEHSFAWIKSYAVLNQIYEKTLKSYNGLLLMGNSMILSGKIIKERN